MPLDTTKYETANRSMVAVQGDNIRIMMIRPMMSKAEALNLAAWIVALADDDDQFNDLRSAVENI